MRPVVGSQMKRMSLCVADDGPCSFGTPCGMSSRGCAFSLSLSFKVSVFSLSFVICLRTRALVALSRGGLSPATAAAMVRGEKGFGDSERAAQIGVGLSGFVLMGWALVPKETPIY